jgi:hypothetical protein
VIAELCEALRVAGVPDDNVQAAARTRASHERRFNRIDADLTTFHGEIKALEGEIVMVACIAGASPPVEAVAFGWPERCGMGAIG